MRDVCLSRTLQSRRVRVVPARPRALDTRAGVAGAFFGPWSWSPSWVRSCSRVTRGSLELHTLAFCAAMYCRFGRDDNGTDARARARFPRPHGLAPRPLRPAASPSATEFSCSPAPHRGAIRIDVRRATRFSPKDALVSLQGALRQPLATGAGTSANGRCENCLRKSATLPKQ
jgi:hypothetical protein